MLELDGHPNVRFDARVRCRERLDLVPEGRLSARARQLGYARRANRLRKSPTGAAIEF
jgi:hypothetical protein